jgi:outer membrane lipoprotein carrier protein
VNPPLDVCAALALSGLFLAAPPSAASVDARSLLDKVQSFYRGAKGIEARFVQQIDSRTLGSPQQEKGVLYLKPPGRMRWEYSQPKGKLAVADGTKVYLYLPEDRQVLVGTLADLDAGAMVTRLLWGESVLGEDFLVEGEPEPEPEGLFGLRLKPKSPDFPYASLTVHIAAKDGSVPRIEMVDPLGNRMEYRFAEIRTGRNLPDKLFTYQIPRGVEIQMLSPPRAAPRPSP